MWVQDDITLPVTTLSNARQDSTDISSIFHMFCCSFQALQTHPPMQTQQPDVCTSLICLWSLQWPPSGTTVLLIPIWPCSWNTCQFWNYHDRFSRLANFILYFHRLIPKPIIFQLIALLRGIYMVLLVCLSADSSVNDISSDGSSTNNSCNKRSKQNNSNNSICINDKMNSRNSNRINIAITAIATKTTTSRPDAARKTTATKPIEAAVRKPGWAKPTTADEVAMATEATKEEIKKQQQQQKEHQSNRIRTNGKSEAKKP